MYFVGWHQWGPKCKPLHVASRIVSNTAVVCGPAYTRSYSRAVNRGNSFAGINRINSIPFMVDRFDCSKVFPIASSQVWLGRPRSLQKPGLLSRFGIDLLPNSVSLSTFRRLANPISRHQPPICFILEGPIHCVNHLSAM